MLLTADLHLTDLVADEYRWNVFEEVLAALHQGEDFFILGDITDRKDRHSAALVNRLVHELKRVRMHQGKDARIHIIMGNHDKPLRGEPFWKFLDNLEGIHFYDQPTICPGYQGDLLLLPFAENPREAWADLPLTRYHCLMLHQPVDGALGEHGFAVSGSRMPILPRTARVYAGDIHTPQKVGVVQYVGAPHPVKFGDDYECRMLRLDHNFDIVEVIYTDPAQKLAVDVSSLEQLYETPVREGDQARVRVRIPLKAIDGWPAQKAAIESWAATAGVHIAQLEAMVETQPALSDADRVDAAPELAADPADVLIDFAEAEKLPPELLEDGLALLERALGRARS